MTPTRQVLGATSSIALIAFAATPSWAEGTQAGEEITNSVSVDYAVGGVAQTTETASATFYVDRKVNVTVAAVGTSPNETTGQTSVVREFSITNLSNTAVGFALGVAQEADPGFVIANARIFDDANANDVVDAGEEITFLNTLASDATKNVKVAFDVPLGVANGTATDIILTATAVEVDTGGATVIAASTGADTAGSGPTDIQTVLADGAGTTDAQYAGNHSAKHTVAVEAADVSVAKTSTVVSDPVNGTTNPKAIPGAIVEYCIVVANGAGATTATGIVLSDDFSAEAANIALLPDAYSTDGDIMVDGDASCTGGTATDKSYTTDTTTVSSALGDVAASASRSLRYRVTIK